MMVGRSSNHLGSLNRVDPQGVGSFQPFPPPPLSLLCGPSFPLTPFSALPALFISTIKPLPLLGSSALPHPFLPRWPLG